MDARTKGNLDIKESEARRQLAEYLPTLEGDIGYTPEPDWLTDTPDFCQCPNGDWLAKHPDKPGTGIFIRENGTCIPFFGALGAMVQPSGWLPVSREYFLASALYGRYQIYGRGLAVWEEFPQVGNFAFPVAQWDSVQDRARNCIVLVAFFDLRGFTAWSSKQTPQALQDTIESFEKAFQDAFSRSEFVRLFSKGTGDGIMVVSEAGNFGQLAAPPSQGLQLGHCEAFCAACAKTVEAASQTVPKELAVGCGIALGKVTQLYLLGRPDYIGSPVNDASKIQAIAYGEVCVSTEILEELERGGRDVAGTVIPGKGKRVATGKLSGLGGAKDRG